MAHTDEPADGGYVAVKVDDEDYDYRIYRRRDDIAAFAGLAEARWLCRSDSSVPALTWVGVTDLGPVAYVGEFVNRQEA